MTCKCGKDGRFKHSIDGESVELCTECHAALRFLMTNHSGLTALAGIYRAFDEEDSVLDRFRKEDPEEYKGVEKNEIKRQPGPEAKPVSSGMSIFLPLKDNHNEVRRAAPEV